MADNKGNIFKRFGKKVSDVFAELKRVTWPTGEKLAKTAAVVLLVIVFFAVYLTIGNGGRWILDKVGFYDIVETTATTTEAAETTTAAETSASATETESSAEG